MGRQRRVKPLSLHSHPEKAPGKIQGDLQLHPFITAGGEGLVIGEVLLPNSIQRPLEAYGNISPCATEGIRFLHLQGQGGILRGLDPEKGQGEKIPSA